MKKIMYVTGNPYKFRLAQTVCRQFDIELVQTVPEIQAEDGEPVARDKAQKAFGLLQQPVIVSDDSWMIPALKNFPGPYMKSMNTWFTPEDWLRLTGPLDDRRIILRQIAVYQDADQQKLFSMDIQGLLLHEARGKSAYPHAMITSFDGGKTSNAEHHERGENAAKNHHTTWHDLGKWLSSQQ